MNEIVTECCPTCGRVKSVMYFNPYANNAAPAAMPMYVLPAAQAGHADVPYYGVLWGQNAANAVAAAAQPVYVGTYDFCQCVR